MAVFAFIMVVSFLFGLSSSIDKSDKFPGRAKTPEKFDAPVAQTYKVLNWYAGYHLLYTPLLAGWWFMFAHPWKRYTPQYIERHHYHHTAQFLQTQEKEMLLVWAVVLLLPYIYILFSKNLKAITGILIVFAGIDVAKLLSELSKPAYHVLLGIPMAAFTFLALWSLLMREKDFRKMLRTLSNHLRS